MKYHSFNNKKKYKHRTIKHKLSLQKGGTIMSIINENPNSQIIGPKDIYPSEYIGYTVFVPPESKPFTLEQLVSDSFEEGNFFNADKTVNLSKLNEQVMNDSFRMNLFINNTSIFNSFKNKINKSSSNEPNIFNEQLTELQPITEPNVFSAKLLEIFPKLNVKENEITCIQDFANKNNWTIFSNYWAFLPFYDEIINERGITDETKLNNIKILSQQNISKSMMDILMKFVSLPSIFHNTLQLGGSFKTFGNKMNDYITQIPTAPFIYIDISSNNITIQNKLYFSLVNIENEFGLAVISTCIYADFQKNEVFMIWKIERWRNMVIKQYYQFIVNMSKKTPISEELLNLMQTYMYNNKISDSYPKTHKELLDYFMKNNNKDAIDKINIIVKEQLTKNTNDKDIAKIIQLVPNQVGQLVQENIVQENLNQENIAQEPQLAQDNTQETQASESLNDADRIEETKETESAIDQDNIVQETLASDQQALNADEDKIKETKENESSAIDQYNQDQQRLRDDQPPPSDSANVISTLATLGAITALGAIGTGLYLSVPLLAGGSNKRNRKSKKTKTRRHK